MMSCKGFLSPGPNRLPRLTAKHKAAILDALATMREHEISIAQVSPTERAGLTYAELVVARMIDLYPTDRSCHTCDYYRAGDCLHWKEVIPTGALEAGCDNHKEQGAPF